jgi:hypothetical protein
LLNSIKEKQMAQNKKVNAGMALAIALLGMGISATASALPEVEVGTMPPIVAPTSVNTVDSTVAEPEAMETQDSAS